MNGVIILPESDQTIEIYELVMCRSCIYWIRHDKRCKKFNHGTKQDFWCKWGEEPDNNDLYEGES